VCAEEVLTLGCATCEVESDCNTNGLPDSCDLAGPDQRAKLTANDVAAQNAFGASVGISGDVAVIGAQLDDDNGIDSGAAYVYQNEQGVWVEVAKLTGDGVVAGRRIWRKCRGGRSDDRGGCAPS
jgi:hypothetical protein